MRAKSFYIVLSLALTSMAVTVFVRAQSSASGGGGSSATTTLTYAPQAFAIPTVALGAAATTTILNDAAPGELLGITLNAGTVTGSATGSLNVTFDGGTVQSYPILIGNNAVTWTNTVGGSTLQCPCTGNATATTSIFFYATYKTSALVSVTITGTATGTLNTTVLRALKV